MVDAAGTSRYAYYAGELLWSVGFWTYFDYNSIRQRTALTNANNGTVTTLIVDSKNQLTSVGGSSCTYDNNGNLTFSSRNGVTYSYDDENQLISAETATNWRTEWVYDGRGRVRVRKEYTWNSGWVLNSETRYLYDGMRVIQERNSGNTPTVSYTRGIDLRATFEGAGGIGGLLARSSGYSSGSWSTHHFYHADGGGNVTYMVDGSQAMVASYRYDPFGNTISSSGTQASANVYRFSSKEIYVNTGIYYYGYRFYDPNLQRWPNRDPIGEDGGQNLYAFVANNPVGKVDAFGHQLFRILRGCLKPTSTGGPADPTTCKQ